MDGCVLPGAVDHGVRGVSRHSVHPSTGLFDRVEGPTRHFDVPLDERDQADDQHWQRWTGETLVEGDALPEGALFGAALFELTGLSAWWPYTGWLGEKDPVRGVQHYEYPNPSTADCGEGLVVNLHARRSESRASVPGL